jgi:hypothetical protein
LEGKLVGSRPTGRPRRRRDDNIKVDFKEIRWEGVDWIHLAEGRDHLHVVVNNLMNHRESLNPERALTSLVTTIFPRGFLIHAVLVADIYLLRSVHCFIKVSSAKNF